MSDERRELDEVAAERDVLAREVERLGRELAEARALLAGVIALASSGLADEGPVGGGEPVLHPPGESGVGLNRFEN